MTSEKYEYACCYECGYKENDGSYIQGFWRCPKCRRLWKIEVYEYADLYILELEM